MNKRSKPTNHIVLTSHPSSHHQPPEIRWGAQGPEGRGPIIGTLTHPSDRNVIGTHSGSYAIYRALAVAAGSLDPGHKPDLTNTAPTTQIGPFPQWSDPDRIVSLDPYGHLVEQAFQDHLKDGYDVRPTIAVTQARINLPEMREAIAAGRLSPDGVILGENGDVAVTKAAIEPVWYLPGLAHRLQIKESELRRILFEQSGTMFPELVTRPDLKVFLPPIGGQTVYIVGDIEALWDPKRKVACRVHDECNGSDVFGSDICTCRPYLIHGIEICVQAAQDGGAGLIIYNRKEGRALGEVTKFLVYNARKRHVEGDSAAGYFERTECVAGVQDMRFQELMPDVFHWLGITRIDEFVSMSNMKHDALVRQGIEIVDRTEIPEDLVPADAQVEIHAKKAAGYYPGNAPCMPRDLTSVKGRDFTDF